MVLLITNLLIELPQAKYFLFTQKPIEAVGSGPKRKFAKLP